MENATETTTAHKKKTLPWRQIIIAHPAVFSRPCRPLRIGVFDDLMRAHEGQISKKEISAMMAIHTSTLRYLIKVAAGGPRYALDGSEDGVVTEIEQEGARERIREYAARRHASGMAIKQRSSTLKAFEASGLGRNEYAQKVGISINEMCSVLDKAVVEREERRKKRLRIVENLERSGLSPEDFASREKISVPQLNRIIGKVAALRAAAG